MTTYGGKTLHEVQQAIKNRETLAWNVLAEMADAIWRMEHDLDEARSHIDRMHRERS